MADIFGYNYSKDRFGNTIRTPAIDYSALGDYGLQFLKNTVNLPTNLWNANKAVGNQMLKGIKALDNAMYTYNPDLAGQQVKQFVTKKQQSNTQVVVPDKPKNTKTKTTQQKVNAPVVDTKNDSTVTTPQFKETTQQVKASSLPKFDDAAQLAFSDTYNKALSPDATPADIAKVQQMSNKYGLGMTSQDVMNARNYQGQPVQEVATTNVQPVAGGTVTSAMFSNPLINPVYQGTINGQPVSVEQGQLGSLDAGSITGFNQMGGDYTGYSMPNAGTTSSLGNTSFANGLSNSTNLPNGQVSPSSGWDKYLSSFTTTNKPYGSYGEAWSQGNKEGGVLGGISNLWNQFTTEGGTIANPTASGLEKSMQGLGQLASLYSGIMNAKYQKDLMNLANRQQAFQEAQTNRVNSMQDQAQANYAKSFNV